MSLSCLGRRGPHMQKGSFAKHAQSAHTKTLRSLCPQEKGNLVVLQWSTNQKVEYAGNAEVGVAPTQIGLLRQNVGRKGPQNPTFASSSSVSIPSAVHASSSRKHSKWLLMLLSELKTFSLLRCYSCVQPPLLTRHFQDR